MIGRSIRSRGDQMKNLDGKWWTHNTNKAGVGNMGPKPVRRVPKREMTEMDKAHQDTPPTPPKKKTHRDLDMSPPGLPGLQRPTGGENKSRSYLRDHCGQGGP